MASLGLDDGLVASLGAEGAGGGRAGVPPDSADGDTGEKQGPPLLRCARRKLWGDEGG